MGNIDAFLDLTDQKGRVKGESIDDQHKELLQIENFSFGVESQASAATGTGLGAGKAVMKNFSFDVQNSIASPTLFKHCCSGHHCPSAILYIRKAGGTPKDYYVWKFKDLVITGFELNCGVEIVEKITISYTGLYCEYKQQDAKGELGSAIKGGWDVKFNKEWTG
ncbi:MAG TPA: type VI secretion system tube protein Hcp [Phycisphaerae bacterium]|jgi:type VI secretion system secreted protein Hcp|nr:type VI secretion system tube protein Hcp [Phycisphaerae bacterium]